MIRERDDKFISFQKMIMCRFGNEMHPGFTSDVSQNGMGINSLPRLPLNFNIMIY